MTTTALVVIVNVAAFVAMGIDKLAARLGWWRIPEICLLGLATAGGWIGILVGMQMMRHKTQKPSFVNRLAPCCLVGLVVLVLVLRA